MLTRCGEAGQAQAKTTLDLVLRDAPVYIYIYILGIKYAVLCALQALLSQTSAWFQAAGALRSCRDTSCTSKPRMIEMNAGRMINLPGRSTGCRRSICLLSTLSCASNCGLHGLQIYLERFEKKLTSEAYKIHRNPIKPITP